jgi:hypothetical protein
MSAGRANEHGRYLTARPLAPDDGQSGKLDAPRGEDASVRSRVHPRQQQRRVRREERTSERALDDGWTAPLVVDE